MYLTEAKAIRRMAYIHYTQIDYIMCFLPVQAEICGDGQKVG